MTPRAIDATVTCQFLQIAYDADDWIGILAKSHRSGHTVQRVRPAGWFRTPRVQAWLRALSAQRWSHYVTANALTPGQRSRQRAVVAHIRHVLLDADQNGPAVVRAITESRDLPPPSYVIHSSLNRVHILWRVAGFVCDYAEALQRHLARELHTDGAATACSQLTRLPGFPNHKYTPPPLVSIEYADPLIAYTPHDFPQPLTEPRDRPTRPQARRASSDADVRDRARRYLAVVEPAITGQHGDQHTFEVCCRLVRGFALSDADALDILADWNARCEPPWTTSELVAKLRHAREYGREPIGGLLDSS